MIVTGIFTLATLLAILIAAFMGHLLTKSRENKKRFIEAYEAFREVFLPAIQDLGKDLRDNDITRSSILPSEFPKHEIAMAKFVPNLKGRRRIRFDEKWKEYQTKYEEYEKDGVFTRSLYFIGINQVGFNEERHKVSQIHKKEMLNLIHDILKIAKNH